MISRELAGCDRDDARSAVVDRAVIRQRGQPDAVGSRLVRGEDRRCVRPDHAGERRRRAGDLQCEPVRGKIPACSLDRHLDLGEQRAADDGYGHPH